MTAKGISHILLGSYSDAEKSLNEALSIDPRFSDAIAAQVALTELKAKKSEEETTLSSVHSRSINETD